MRGLAVFENGFFASVCLAEYPDEGCFFYQNNNLLINFSSKSFVALKYSVHLRLRTEYTANRT